MGMFSRRLVAVNGPVIVGAGPSELAMAARLREQGVRYVIVEQSDCIASGFQKRSNRRLQLPNYPFPDHYPDFPSKQQFVEYLDSYTIHHDIRPHFNETVHSAKYDDSCRLWRVRTSSPAGEVEYVCPWLVVDEPVIDGLADFDGAVVQSCDYMSGEEFKGKKVLVVGCNHAFHSVPRGMFGKSIFMMKWLPLWLFLWIIQKISFTRPEIGPFDHRALGIPVLDIDAVVIATGYRRNITSCRRRTSPARLYSQKPPVLDIDTLEMIGSKERQLVTGAKRFCGGGGEPTGKNKIDAVVLATGYRSNITDCRRRTSSTN